MGRARWKGRGERAGRGPEPAIARIVLRVELVDLVIRSPIHSEGHYAAKHPNNTGTSLHGPGQHPDTIQTIETTQLHPS